MCTWLTGTEERDKNCLNATLTTFRWVRSNMAAPKLLQGKPKHVRTQPSKKRKTRNTGWSNNLGQFRAQWLRR